MYNVDVNIRSKKEQSIENYFVLFTQKDTKFQVSGILPQDRVIFEVRWHKKFTLLNNLLFKI